MVYLACSKLQCFHRQLDNTGHAAGGLPYVGLLSAAVASCQTVRAAYSGQRTVAVPGNAFLMEDRCGPTYLVMFDLYLLTEN